MRTWTRILLVTMLAMSAAAWLASDAVAARPLASHPHSRGIVPRTPVPVTIEPTGVAGPTATLSLSTGFPKTCPDLEDRGVPKGHIERALEDPMRVAHWNEPADPNKPVSPFNLRRRRLSIQANSKPYHSLFNGLVFKAGCP